MGWSPGLKSIHRVSDFEDPIGLIKKTSTKKQAHQDKHIHRGDTIVTKVTAQAGPNSLTRWLWCLVLVFFILLYSKKSFVDGLGPRMNLLTPAQL